MFTLGVRDTSASSVKHPLFPLCVCFEIVLDNPFGVVVLFYPLSVVELPIFICLTSLLHTTFVRSFPFCVRKFSTICRFLERMKTDDANPETVAVRCVLFAYALFHRSVGPGLYVM